MSDLTLAKSQRKTDGITVFTGFGLARRTLAAATTSADRRCFGKLRRPYDLTADTHPAIDLADSFALTRARQPETVDLAMLNDVRALPHQPLVDHLTKGRPHDAANRDRRQTRNRTANRTTDRRACS